jgi:aminoglycoside phosphotransferase (APT) family kinase protein
MTQPVWAGDIPIDSALALRLISIQFSELRAQRLVPFGIGWDNAAFLVDEKTVFRFPRRRVAAGLIEREATLLPLIAPHVPLAISASRYVGSPSPEYPWVFAGYELIAGSTACTVALSEEARGALAEPLARFLRALHAIELAPLVANGLPPDEIGRLDPGKRLRLAQERLPTVARAGSPENIDRFAIWLETHPPEPIDPAKRTLVHGDLYARHILLDAGAHPTGVIDWGDVHLGDPALDIAIALLMLPATAYAAFRAAYGPIDDRTWTAARYRAIYHAFVEIDYGIRADDAGMRTIGLAALQLMARAENHTG